MSKWVSKWLLTPRQHHRPHQEVNNIINKKRRRYSVDTGGQRHQSPVLVLVVNVISQQCGYWWSTSSVSSVGAGD